MFCRRASSSDAARQEQRRAVLLESSVGRAGAVRLLFAAARRPGDPAGARGRRTHIGLGGHIMARAAALLQRPGWGFGSPPSPSYETHTTDWRVRPAKPKPSIGKTSHLFLKAPSPIGADNWTNELHPSPRDLNLNLFPYARGVGRNPWRNQRDMYTCLHACPCVRVRKCWATTDLQLCGETFIGVHKVRMRRV